VKKKDPFAWTKEAGYGVSHEHQVKVTQCRDKVMELYGDHPTLEQVTEVVKAWWNKCNPKRK
jgi:hypothetical protein